MAKVNYDYPLNPTWNKPSVFGSSLEHRWYVYANYTVNEKRFQYKESSGLNDKADTLEIRIQKAETVKVNLIEMLLTRHFEPKTKTFSKTYNENQKLTDLSKEYLIELKERVSYHTFHNYKTILNYLNKEFVTASIADLNKKVITTFLKGFDIKLEISLKQTTLFRIKLTTYSAGN